MKFRTQYNIVPRWPKASEKPSRTVPDQSLSIAQIMQRYAQGKPVKSNNLVYTGANFAPDTRELDIEELYQMREQNKERILRNREELENLAREVREKDPNKADPKDEGTKDPKTDGSA